jgi:hypothetical protein
LRFSIQYRDSMRLPRRHQAEGPCRSSRHRKQWAPLREFCASFPCAQGLPAGWGGHHRLSHALRAKSHCPGMTRASCPRLQAAEPPVVTARREKPSHSGRRSTYRGVTHPDGLPWRHRLRRSRVWLSARPPAAPGWAAPSRTWMGVRSGTSLDGMSGQRLPPMTKSSSGLKACLTQRPRRCVRARDEASRLEDDDERRSEVLP